MLVDAFSLAYTCQLDFISKIYVYFLLFYLAAKFHDFLDIFEPNQSADLGVRRLKMPFQPTEHLGGSSELETEISWFWTHAQQTADILTSRLNLRDQSSEHRVSRLCRKARQTEFGARLRACPFQGISSTLYLRAPVSTD